MAALLAAPAAAQVNTGPGAEYFLLLPLFPMAYAHGFLAEQGYASSPYSSPEGYLEGDRDGAGEVSTSFQATEGGRRAFHAQARYRHAERLGASAAWSRYEAGALRHDRASHWSSAHLTASLLEDSRAMLEWGVGAASLQSARNRWGPSFELDFEWLPMKPLTLHARWQGGFLPERRLHLLGYNDLSAHVGAAVGKLGLSVGYRAFLNPQRHAYGPEAVLRLWL